MGNYSHLLLLLINERPSASLPFPHLAFRIQPLLDGAEEIETTEFPMDERLAFRDWDFVGTNFDASYRDFHFDDSVIEFVFIYLAPIRICRRYVNIFFFNRKLYNNSTSVVVRIFELLSTYYVGKRHRVTKGFCYQANNNS